MFEQGRSGCLFVVGIGALILSVFTICLYTTLKEPHYNLPGTAAFLAVVALFCRHRFQEDGERIMLVVGTATVLLALLLDVTALVLGVAAGICC